MSHPVIPKIRNYADIKLSLDNIRSYFKRLADQTSSTPVVHRDPPIGSVMFWPITVAPWGWHSCDGASVLRTEYAAVFAVIGTIYGSVDGTHFNFPNFATLDVNGIYIIRIV